MATVFEDGFEDGNADGWDLNPSSGVVEVNSNFAYNGTYSLYTFTSEGDGTASAQMSTAYSDVRSVTGYLYHESSEEDGNRRIELITPDNSAYAEIDLKFGYIEVANANGTTSQNDNLPNSAIAGQGWTNFEFDITETGVTINFLGYSVTQSFSTNPQTINWRAKLSNNTNQFGSGTNELALDGIVFEKVPFAPNAPQNVSATVDADDQITLSWDANTSAGEADEFEIEVDEASSGYSDVATVGSGTTTYSYSATPSVNSHQFRVRATNDVGSSSWAESGAVDTDASALTVDGIRDTEVDLSWNGADDASGYHIYQSESSDTVRSDYQEVATVTGSSTTIPGLENEEHYYWRVAAYYSDGDSQLTNEVDGTTTLPSPTLDIVSGSYREVTLDWTLNDNSSDGNVTIYRDGSAVTTITDLTTTNYVDDGLLDGEKYNYYVERETGDATASSGSLEDVTDLPAPTGLAVDAVAAESVDLSWVANHNNGETRVEFRQSDVTSWTVFGAVSYGTEVETITGLLNGEQYDARVVAQTDHSETVDQ